MGGTGGQEPNQCRPGVDLIGKRIGYGQARIRVIIKELDDMGWINVQRRNGQANRYYATTPADVVVDESVAPKVAKAKRVSHKCLDCGGVCESYLYAGEIVQWTCTKCHLNWPPSDFERLT
jgi:hypothetical protein